MCVFVYHWLHNFFRRPTIHINSVVTAFFYVKICRNFGNLDIDQHLIQIRCLRLLIFGIKNNYSSKILYKPSDLFNTLCSS